MKDELKKQMREKGYIVAPADQPEALLELRNQIFERSKKIFGHTGTNAEDFFNHFHSMGVTGTALNELRMKLIRECTTEIDSGRLIHLAFENTLLSLVGPDLLVQKTTNLVIQQPNDPNPSELHRDSPGNSPYEIVVWLPLTESYGSKAMYVLDRPKTREAFKVLGEKGESWVDFEKHCIDSAPNIPVPFGSALFFFPGLLHGSRVNQEKETRWTLNMRYKNVFSPNGLKEPFEFFKILQLSPLAELAIEFQREETFK